MFKIAKAKAKAKIVSFLVSAVVLATPIMGADLYNNNSDVTVASGLTAEQIDDALADTGLANLGEYFIEAEEQEGINAVFLAAIAANESGWGNVSSNLFGSIAYEQGMTKEEQISEMAYILNNAYVIKRGLNTPALIQPRYCPTYSLWLNDVVWIMNHIHDKALN